MQLTHCYDGPNDHFTFAPNGVWHSQAAGSLYPLRCVEAKPIPWPVTFQVWSKPQPDGKLAVFFLNALERTMPAFTVDLVKDLGMTAAELQHGLAVRDIWQRKDLQGMAAEDSALEVREVKARDSAFLLLTPSRP